MGMGLVMKVISIMGACMAVMLVLGCDDGGRGGQDADVVDDASPEGVDEGEAVDIPPDDGDAEAEEGPPSPTAAEYLDRPLVEQVAAIDGRIISGADLLDEYLARVSSRDVGDGGVYAIIALDPGATEVAQDLDGQRGEGARLQGAVILVKDNIDTAGLATTAGSLALAGNVPEADASVVAALRAAHAVVLGKTNLSEWAGFRGYGMTSGWSSLGGQTWNGRNVEFNPCGSSSGSAAAVAAGLASAALGTETDGSIMCPASMNGVVGFKPTVGLVSRSRVIPISSTQDTVGPITRTVVDAARILSVIAGPDPEDPATLAIPGDLSLNFEAELTTASFAGVRLGRVAAYTGYSSAVDAIFADALSLMEAEGATVVDVALPGGYSDAEMTVLLTEFRVGINAYLAAHPQPDQPASLAELIAYNDAHADTVMPYFGQEVFVLAEATTGLDDPAYIAAREFVWQTIGEDGIVAVLEDNDLDALVAPTAGPAFRTTYAGGDRDGHPIASTPAAAAGCPHITVPMGAIDGLPVGLSLFAGPWEDGRVLAFGYAFEQHAAEE
jgi:amidase